jgi:RimJ/RimL family protein N-acetyltransferase
VYVLLQTDRLILRRFTAADAGHLYALDNDPDVMRYINGGTPTPRDAVERDILPTFLCYDDNQPAFGFWAAIEKMRDEWLGWLSFRPKADAPGDVVLGYRLRREAWGRGYATEGARALIELGFTELRAQRVVATTYEYNRASRRVMEKLGMTLVRRFRPSAQDILQSDTYHATSAEVWEGDDVEYALERSDWARRNAQRAP